MENIIKKLRKFKCEFSINSSYFKIEIRDRPKNKLVFVIFCNFNNKRNSFSYIDYSIFYFGKYKEIYVSKKKLIECIKDLKKRCKI